MSSVEAVRVRFGVLGPVRAEDAAGAPIPLKGPMHRAVLARLLVARGRVVPVADLVDDLWVAPPAGALAAVRTFVAALRRALEPDRPPRAPATLLVTAGAGYALRPAPGDVDAWRFEQAVTVAAAADPPVALRTLDEALDWWQGPAYADFADAAWARAERARLTELRLHAAERQAAARLALGRAAAAVPDLDAHVTAHPWREEGWRLLALALYRTGRQADALAVLRRARDLLAGQLGLDPGPALRTLEADVLRQAPHLDHPASPAAAAARSTGGRAGGGAPVDARDAGAEAAAEVAPEAAAGAAAGGSRGEAGGAAGGGDVAGAVWARAAAAFERVGGGAGARLESAVGLLRTLAVTGPGGLEAAREQRAAAVAAAEQLGDPELTARVIGAYDVPAIWTTADDPAQAAAVVAAAERALATLPEARPAVRARLLATVAVESRGTADPRALRRADEAEAIARELDDPALLAFALNGAFMQSCHRTGQAARRDAIGAELVALAHRHALVTAEVLGHLIRMQAAAAVAGFAAADGHAAAADDLAARHELPLVGVFTDWYRALRADLTHEVPAGEAERLYRAAAARLDTAGMPGLRDGLLPLALLGLRLRRGLPLVDEGGWGQYEPWVRPVLDLEAPAAVPPDPPPGLLQEALWSLYARAAVAVGDRAAMRRARLALAPAAGEWAGAASGMLTVGPVSDVLRTLDETLGRGEDS
ncbi:AfsR/SARP family transcriptional regulator [Dactylosporangium sp. AC04546]|uniref:AfsR/SARP family transcriptional regulator n=1 Tax=Dactylosporangium sp. AC04546 TaxID=2862460 RepID=UPI002E7B5DB7|nr:AfsR/SARP family transcriptional regulator [Dactylosporangium sp. AC04546]WVK78217.1 AfsR/SARP family transcriptional regulator [Dactylosporangium sp. AC04546]